MKIRKHVLGLTILLIVLLIGCSRAAKEVDEPIAAEPGSLKGKVAFVSTRGDIRSGACVINADGTGLKRVTEKANITRIAWSPDGEALLFDAADDEDTKTAAIYLYRNGTTDVVVKRANETCNGALWHPSGKKIYHSRSKDGTRTEFVELDLAAKTERVIKRFDTPIFASISPDGKRIAFSISTGEGRYVKEEDIFIMDANGTNVKNITSRWRKNWSDWSPAWSPDGKKIAFMSTQNGAPNIYIMDADGRNRRRITENKHEGFLPCWSPDGTKIAYTAALSWYEGDKYFEKMELFVIDIETLKVWQLTKAAKSKLGRGLTLDTSPVWTD